ncbi:MAG: glycosyltransferase family 4 protein [Asgard group archaeon]|nr:glycosyltransferase family 4 protein [Asgard group archaeon]
MEELYIIAFFVERFSKDDIGGVKSYIRRMSKALMTEDIEVAILSVKSKDLPESEKIDGIQVERVNCGDFIDKLNQYNNMSESEKAAHAKELFKKNDIEETALKLAQKLNDFIDKYNPVAIHFHNSFFIAPYALYFLKQILNRTTGPSFYFWCHSPPKELITPDGEMRNLYNALRSFQNQFSGIFGISQTVTNQLTQYGIKSKTKYLGIDSNLFQKRNELKSDFRSKLNISKDAFVILYAGRILKEKGLDLIPVIYKQLLKRDLGFLRIHFIIAGQGYYKDELIKTIKKESIENNFHFITINNDDELVDLYSSVNCLIMPTRREALGMSLLEAMSCSLPCISSDLPGTRELIIHTKNGLLVPQDDVNEYIRWVSSVYSNKKLRENLGVAARESVVEKFNFKEHLFYFIRKLMK